MDIPDTLALAGVDRANQGSWEAEYSYGAEADLHRHYDRCVKNPGHKDFIPVEKFSIEDLPESYRDQEIIDYIKAESDLTVRVTVQYVSDRRPQTVPGSDRPYPGNGGGKMTVGTGFIQDMDAFRPEDGKTCQCKDCQKSSKPETKFAVIYISTATHVVFDDLEGAHTTCHLFFDRGGTPYTCDGVVTLTGMSSIQSSVGFDWCMMQHFTHDLNLAFSLKEKIFRRHKLEGALTAKLPLVFSQSVACAGKKPLLIIVSHPHGCSKHISIGHWTAEDHRNPKAVCYEYTTATCPGSSGAHICLLNHLANKGKFKDSGSHCGKSLVQPGSNYCHIPEGFPRLSLPMERVTLDTDPWEDSSHCEEGEDQHTHSNTCQKNPGHHTFFPIDKFSMDILPAHYRTDEAIEMIECVSDLTVQLSISYVSEARPATVPDTSKPYPWYSQRGSNLVRTGTGMVDDIWFPESSDRQTNSSLPEDFVQISVQSVVPLVFDRREAEHTTCHLFFDSGEAPALCSDVVTLTNPNVYGKTDKSGMCYLTYGTQNRKLADKLMTIRYKHRQWFSSYSKFYPPPIDCGDVQGSLEKDTSLEIPLLVVVSHPHGGAKQISLDYDSNLNKTDKSEYHEFFTTITCEGCLGAPVIALGTQRYYPFCK